MPEAEEYSLPLQQVARVAASQPESLTPAERDAFSGVLDLTAARERYHQEFGILSPENHNAEPSPDFTLLIQREYNGELSDPIKDLWNEQATPEQKSAFFRTWLAMLPKHLGTYFSATFHNNYGYLTPGYVSVVKPTLLIGKQGHTTDLDEGFAFSINAGANALASAMDALVQQPLFRLILAPGIYGWITLFALVTLLGSKKKSLLLVAFPALFALMGCLLSAVNGYFRYAMPLYFCAPVLLALCAEAGRGRGGMENGEL